MQMNLWKQKKAQKLFKSIPVLLSLELPSEGEFGGLQEKNLKT